MFKMNRSNLSCTTCPNTNCLISRHCSLKTKRLIDRQKGTLRIRKNHQVFYEGAAVTSIYFIHSGKAKVFKTGPRGKRQIIRLAKSGDILGHRGFGGKLLYPVGAETAEDSQICSLGNNFFFELLKDNRELTFHLMMFYAEELKNSETRMRNLSQMNVREKVAEALLMISRVFGETEKGGRRKLGSFLSRRDLADIAGITPEQGVRTLSEFKRDHLIETEGSQIFVLDDEGLKSLIADFDPTH